MACQAHIRIYSTRFCPFCGFAKQLLHAKGCDFEEIMVDTAPDKREEMMRLSGRRSVPQIWIGEDHIGGFSELRALDESGRLDAMLAGEN